MHKIIIERGVLTRIAKDIGCSTRTVQNALRFVTEGEQPDLIRDRAINFYSGVLIKKPINIRKKS